jgi:DNA polymerase-1
MLRIRDSIAGDTISFHYVQSKLDIPEFRQFVRTNIWLAIDTESTGLNCYHPQWKLRTVQCGNATRCYVIPARFYRTIQWLMKQEVKWIAHNGPHDIRSIDAFLGYETGVVCVGETYIPAHHLDSRNQQEGGSGHGLKELSVAMVDRNADKWERDLKAEFKTITVPIPGETYKSGPRKGQPKMRKARLSEGWALINPENPVYIAYAAADPILTYRIWHKLMPVVRQNKKLYLRDHAIQVACDRLQRRAMRLDVKYTTRLSAQYLKRANKMREIAHYYGCENIHSGQQVAMVLTELGVELKERTPTGKFKTDDRILRKLVSSVDTEPEVKDFLHAVLLAKQLLKRRESYTEQMLSEMDSESRVHPSINSLGARTARMSVSRPPLQQLPTKDRGEDE